MPVGIINFSNISNINSNEGMLYCYNNDLYFKDSKLIHTNNKNLEITEVGTITTGIWNGTSIENSKIANTLSNKRLEDVIISKTGISDNTLLIGENSTGDFLYKELQLGSGLNLTGSDNSIFKLNLDSSTNKTYNSFSSNAYWISPPFINNALNDNNTDFQTMNIAYQNLSTEFDHYILHKDVIATNLTLIQSQEETTTYEINIIKNNITYSENIDLISDTNTKLLIKSDRGSLYLNKLITTNSSSQPDFNGTVNTNYFIFDGIDNYFEIPVNISPELANSSFTIELWFKTDLTLPVVGTNVIFSQGTYNNNLTSIDLIINGNDLILDLCNYSVKIDLSLTNINNWNHYAVSFDLDGSNLIDATKFYINGLLQTTLDNLSGSNDIVSIASGAVFIGKHSVNTNYLKGKLNKLKIWNSVRTLSEIQQSCYYNGNLNSTIQNDDIYLTTLVSDKTIIENLVTYISMKSNNNIYYTDFKVFNDSSSFNHIINQFGNTHHRISQNVINPDENTIKFGSTSIYFDGLGDYLSVVNNSDFHLDSEDFTIELWLYLLDLNNTSNGTIFSKFEGSGISNSSYNLFVDSGIIKFVICNSNGSGILNEMTSLTNLILKKWYHICVSRTGDTVRLFINGNLEVSYTLSLDFSFYNSTLDLFIGCKSNINSFLNGYLEELRFSKGLSRYDATFSVPTSPFNITQTKRISLTNNILFSEGDKLKISINNSNNSNVSGEEVLVILDGYYNDTYVNSSWNRSDSILYTTDSKVGIGTNNPLSTLHLNSNITNNIKLLINNQNTINTNAKSLGKIGWIGCGRNPDTQNLSAFIEAYNNNGENDYTSNLRFVTLNSDTNASSYSDRMIITKDGNIGINISNPDISKILDINGDIKITGTGVFSSTLSCSSGSNIGDLTFLNGSISNANGNISFTNNNLSTSGTLNSGNLNISGTGIFSSSITSSSSNIGTLTITDSSITDSNNIIHFGDNLYFKTGRIGISTNNPLSCLHILGSKQITTTYEGIHLGKDSNQDYGIELSNNNGNMTYIDFTNINNDKNGRISYSNNQLNLSNNTNNPQIIIKNDNNVVIGVDDGKFLGIGNNNPSHKLTISDFENSNNPLLNIDHCSHVQSTHYTYFGGWATGNGTGSNCFTDGSWIRTSSNLHLDAPENNSTYINYYNNGNIYLGNNVIIQKTGNAIDVTGDLNLVSGSLKYAGNSVSLGSGGWTESGINTIFENGNVGIKTNNPYCTLDIRGDLFITTDNYSINPTSKLHIFSGIPNQTLGIDNSTTIHSNYQTMINGIPSYFKILQYKHSNNNNTSDYATRLQQTLDTTKQGYIEFNGLSNNSGLSFGINNNDLLIINSNGNIGIGTNVTTTKLTLEGSFRIFDMHHTGTNSCYFSCSNDDVTFYAGASGNGFTDPSHTDRAAIGTWTNSHLVFYVNGAEKASFHTNGAFHSNGHMYPYTSNNFDVGSTSNRWRYVMANSFYHTGGGIINNSDYRLKFNQVNVINGLDTIMQLDVKKYNKTMELLDIDDNSDLVNIEHIKETGFIAQDVFKIDELQHLVQEGNDKNIWTLNYEGFIPYNTAAIQELKKEKDELENKVTILETKNYELENKLNQILNRLSNLEKKNN